MSAGTRSESITQPRKPPAFRKPDATMKVPTTGTAGRINAGDVELAAAGTRDVI